MDSVTFKDILNASLLSVERVSSIASIDIFISIFVSLLCSSLAFFVYKNTFQGVLYQKTYGISIVLISLITTVIIMTISGNLILSLGMVGALSIVRFRTAIKDPLDIVFMFWAISIGIANGVMGYKISILSSITFALIVYLMAKIKSFTAPNVLVVNYHPKIEKELNNKLATLTKSFNVKSRSGNKNNLELVADIRTRDQGEKLIDYLSNHSNISSYSIINYSNDISGV
jgi:uncharacterized membrane protein YhiD involved in acid resistance